MALPGSLHPSGETYQSARRTKTPRQLGHTNILTQRRHAYSGNEAAAGPVAFAAPNRYFFTASGTRHGGRRPIEIQGAGAPPTAPSAQIGRGPRARRPSHPTRIRRRGQVVRQRPAKPLSPVRIRSSPLPNLQSSGRPGNHAPAGALTPCLGGGTGRRKGLKIPRASSRAGSSPALGIIIRK